MPFWHQMFTIFMLYALLSRKFVAVIYALFTQFFWTEKQNPQSLSLFGCMDADNDTQ